MTEKETEGWIQQHRETQEGGRHTDSVDLNKTKLLFSLCEPSVAPFAVQINKHKLTGGLNINVLAYRHSFLTFRFSKTLKNTSTSSLLTKISLATFTDSLWSSSSGTQRVCLRLLGEPERRGGGGRFEQCPARPA